MSDLSPEQIDGLVAAELLARRKAVGDLHEFVVQAWPIMEPGYSFKDSWHIQAICEHLEAVYSGQIRNLLINVPPRSLKTLLTGVAWPVWCWLQKPTEKFIFGSYSYSLAEDASIKCRALIRSKWFRDRWGDKIQITDDRDTKEYFSNTKGGERIITSVDGTLTGRGGDILVGDDLNNVKDQSEVVLQNALHFFKTVLPTRLNDPKTGRKVIIQQRTNENDVSGYILKEMPDDYVKLILPMEFEPDRLCVTVPLKSTKGKKWRDPRTKENQLLCPEQSGEKEVAQLKRQLGDSYAIAGQLQQRPAPAAGGIIKKNYFRLWKERFPPKIEFTVASWDTAMSKKDMAAYSACTVWGVFFQDYRPSKEWGVEQAAEPVDHGADMNGRVANVILLNAWRGRLEYPELRRQIRNMALDWRNDNLEKVETPDPKYKPDMNLIERKVSGFSLIQELSRTGEIFTGFDPDKFGDKTNRVRLITHILEAGRVWIPALPPDFDKPRSYGQLVIDQAIVFPRASSRDMVDTMTQALLRLQISGWVTHPEDAGAEPSSRVEDYDRPALY